MLSVRFGFNDLVKNRGVNVSLFLVLVLSALLMATGAMVVERLLGSVDSLFAEAKPPHYLQMHRGDYDEAELAAFAESRPELDTWLIEEMLGFDSAAISWERPSTGESGDLSASLIDNLFVSQNAEFDYLIDQEGEVAEPVSGEVYVPVAYRQQFDLEQGDRIGVLTDSGTKHFEVQGFVRDSQMASSLSSSTRFLVADSDLQEMSAAGGGSPEIIVEYRLDDPSDTAAFQTAYDSDPPFPGTGRRSPTR